MSSLRKIEANRENGKLGGPKTPDGKMKSALNAVKHGLSGNTLVLTNESRPMYNDLLDAFVERFQPADAVEFELLLEMVAARWRLRRVWSIETAMIDVEMDDQEDNLAKDRGDVDEVVRIALAFKSLAEGKGLSLLSRYEARLRRIYEKALADLRQLQSTRPPRDIAPLAVSKTGLQAGLKLNGFPRSTDPQAPLKLDPSPVTNTPNQTNPTRPPGPGNPKC